MLWAADNKGVTVCAQPERIVLELPGRDRARPGIGLGIFIGICVVSALIGRLSYLAQPFDSDGAMFIYMGKLVSEGGRVGAELIDNKFPTVGLVTSAAWRSFGDFWPGYVLLQTAMAFGGAVMLARAARKHIGRQAGLASGLFALVYLNFNFAVFGGFQLETLQAFFGIVAASAALSALGCDDARDSMVVGLAAGMAAMLKPSGVAVLGAFAIAMLWRRRSEWRRLSIHALAAGLGLAIPMAVTLIYLFAADLLGQMPTIWRQIAAYAAQSPWEAWDLSKPAVVIILAGFPMLVRGVIFRRAEHRAVNYSNQAALMFVIVWAILEAMGVAAQRRMYAYHFLVLAAPASLLFGFIPRRNELIPLAAALGLPICLSMWGAVLTLKDAHDPVEHSAASQYLSAHANPGDAVWEDGMMRLLIETDLKPGSRYPMTFLWVNTDDAPLEYCHAMLKDFDERHPEYILLPAPIDPFIEKLSNHIKELGLNPRRKANFIAGWQELRDYVLKNYHPVAQAGRETVYRRGK